ncbi:MAG TPA: ATP-binding protein, partial [Desulfomonilaceae bacterium]|nr:ATP-binding protein [Desulfomonilaceae bacterium]
MFFDRQIELDFFNGLLTRKHPGPAQLCLLTGRRRVGKSELLLQWASKSGMDFTYWEAVKENPTQQRSSFYGRLLGIPASAAPVYRSWPELWDAAAVTLQEKRKILILDELPYAAAADGAMLSSLQYAWDQYFQKSKIVLVLCGSHVRVMQTLNSSEQSPLFGRFTAKWYLEPLPFSSLADFFPKWDASERVAAYAIAGGVPAYLTRLDPDLDLSRNIRQIIVKPGSQFLDEPMFIMYDEVKEPGNYLAILKAIGGGAHTITEIRDRAFIPVTSLPFYLQTLQDLRLVERRLPVTQTADPRRARNGRYHLSDPYFRFYFRFIEPFLSSPPFDPDRLLDVVSKNLRGFVGGTTFEDLARQWVRLQGKAGKLPFAPEAVGSHWSARVQVDVVAINRATHEILLGECKWGNDAVSREVVRELIEQKTPLVLKDIWDGKDWKVHYALFARRSFTQAAKEEMRKHRGLLVDLKMIDQ